LPSTVCEPESGALSFDRRARVDVDRVGLALLQRRRRVGRRRHLLVADLLRAVVDLDPVGDREAEGGRRPRDVEAALVDQAAGEREPFTCSRKGLGDDRPVGAGTEAGFGRFVSTIEGPIATASE
jgi:hypothetical protein